MLAIPNTEQLKLKDDIPAWQGMCKHHDEAGCAHPPQDRTVLHPDSFILLLNYAEQHFVASVDFLHVAA